MLEAIIKATQAEPRDYQTRIVQQVTNLFEAGVKSCLINSPTGSGKTVMALLAARLMQARHPEAGIGWIAMRRNLLHQAAAENIELGVNVEGIRFISMFEKNPKTEDEQGRKLSLLVVDEAQHDAVSSMAHLHNLVQPRWVLGMTATPYRTDRVKLCFDKVIRDIGIRQLIQMGYLAQYHHYTITEWTVDSVVGTYLREPERWGKSAIYWHKREDALECVRRLKEAGIRAETVFGDDPMDLREDRLAAFEDKDGRERIDVLVNMMILTEGWDAPALKTVFVRDSQKGPTIQMAGRVFRKYPGIAHKQVVQSKLTHFPMVREADPAEAFVWQDEAWRSYKLSPEIEAIANRAMICIAHVDATMPKFLQDKQKTISHDLARAARRHGEQSESGLQRRDDRGGLHGGAFIH